MRTIVIVIVVALAMQAGALAAEGPGLLVPAYFKPGDQGQWEKLVELAKRRVPVIAVINPDVGPGPQVDAAYTKAVKDLRGAGGKVVGYVFTKQGLRNQAHVMEDITRYHEFYPDLDGLFIDQMPTAETFVELDNRKPSPLRAQFARIGGSKAGKASVAGSARKTMIEYYYRLWLHAKALKSEWLVIGNPGGHPDKEFFHEKTADMFVTYAGYDGYETYQTPAWLKGGETKETAHLIYDVSFAEDMKKRFREAQAHGAQWIYVTDDGGGNPWDTLPKYWDEEIAQFGGGSGGSASEPEKKRRGFFRRKK
jgi:hypothetical protein